MKNVTFRSEQVDETAFVEHRGETCLVPPNSFALARSVERFKLPRNVLAIVLGPLAEPK